MKIGYVSYSPGFEIADQRKALADWAAAKVYAGDVADMTKALRKGDTLGVYGLHRLAPSWRQLDPTLTAIEKKGAVIFDLEKGMAAGMASISRAKTVYAGQAIFASGDDAETRGRSGGNKSAVTRTVPLTVKHKAIWRDQKYRTNEDAALAISNALGKPVSVPTIRRRFGASGRPGGWPGMNK